jgi:hypothetical protein
LSACRKSAVKRAPRDYLDESWIDRPQGLFFRYGIVTPSSFSCHIRRESWFIANKSNLDGLACTLRASPAISRRARNHALWTLPVPGGIRMWRMIRCGSVAVAGRGESSGSAIALSTPVRYAEGLLEMALAIPLQGPPRHSHLAIHVIYRSRVIRSGSTAATWGGRYGGAVRTLSGLRPPVVMESQLFRWWRDYGDEQE